MDKHIKDLPEEIQKIVHQRQKDVGNVPNNNLYLYEGVDDGNFSWGFSKENWTFWSKINSGDYSEFYKLYPSKPMQSSQAITKRSLIELHKMITCFEFRKVIESYLVIAMLKYDDDLINISDEHINRLYKEGSTDQIVWCEGQGIKKPEVGLPKSWEELGKVSGFITNLRIASTNETCYCVPTSEIRYKSVWPTEELEKASVALAQLLQIQKVWRNGWVPDFENNGEYKHVICIRKGKLTRDWFFDLDHRICLPTRELRDQFFNEPKIHELLEIAKPLL